MQIDQKAKNYIQPKELLYEHEHNVKQKTLNKTLKTYF